MFSMEKLSSWLLKSFCSLKIFSCLYVLKQELLLAGADANAVDDEGESVLHRALAKKYGDCAIVILENGGCRSMSILNSQRKT